LTTFRNPHSAKYPRPSDEATGKMQTCGSADFLDLKMTKPNYKPNTDPNSNPTLNKP